MADIKQPFIKKKKIMKNSTIVLFIAWIVFAILDIVALFTNIPLAFGVLFGLLNGMIIIGSIPLFVNEFKNRKYEKYLTEGGKDEL